MMGSKDKPQDELFYAFNLYEFVQKNDDCRRRQFWCPVHLVGCLAEYLLRNLTKPAVTRQCRL
jgi:hypothetical protein